MKYMFFTGMGLIFFFLVSCQSDNEDAGPVFRRYHIESAVIEYDISGKTSGTETLYFDRWGMREAKYVRTQIDDMSFEVLTLIDGRWSYTIDLKTGKGTRTETEMIREYAGKMKDNDLTGIGRQNLKKMGARIVAREDIAGRPCDVWEMQRFGTRTWLWESLPLKTALEMPGYKQVREAVKILSDIKIPEERFQIPEGVIIEDAASTLKTDD